MFEKTARYYDAIYAFKDYASEATQLIEFIDTESPPGGRLLDVACGTGRHLEHLKARFDIVGLDRSPELLEIARERLPDVTFHCADMRSFRLGKTFDVITCLFSSIGYLTTHEDVRKAIDRMTHHLVPNGLLIVEPWFTPEEWHANTVHGLLVDEPELKIARVSTSQRKGRVSYFDLHHLIGTPEKTQHVVEHHELGLHTVHEMLAAFRAAGLTVRLDPEGLTGRGLYIARRQIGSSHPGSESK